MTWSQLQSKSAPHFYALDIDKFFPKGLRWALRYISAFAAVASLALSFGSMPLYFGFADGLFFLCIFVYLTLSFLEFFYRSLLGEGVGSRIRERILDREHIDYSLSTILYKTDDIDASRALFETKIGLSIFEKCGIPENDAKNFVYNNRSPVMTSSIQLSGDSADLVDYVNVLYELDKSLSDFLSRYFINKEEFLGACRWVKNIEDKKRRKERFWSRENLGAIPSIGTSWSYGVSSDLGRYGVPFEYSVNISLLDIETGFRDREVTLLEGILERREGANAIIIDDDESVARDIVGRLLKKMKLGISLPSIEHKNIVELDSNALTATFKEKGGLEAEILKLLNQSVAAGNVILFIRDLAGFVGNAKNLGINLPSILSPYLTSPAVQIIACTTNTDFHYFIETNPTLLEKFDRIIPDQKDAEASIYPVLEQISSIEDEYKITISYPAVLSLVNSADRYVTYGEMPGKALHMLSEVAPWAKDRGLSILREGDVSQFVSEKTGIAVGPLEGQEVEKIEHLEDILHNRIVGQDEAVSGIASAMRRSRSGITNPKRPLASFLFFGPTGVGKTEVSKALAESFFGNEDKMIRFDMSEYNGPDAITRLIGDYVSNKSGILASRLRDDPYSVLLLDEFEKASPDVHDLFLQILDEGMFTDALGKHVNCRSTIIIATSNAGSGSIWDTIKSGKDLVTSKDVIIDGIIKEKIFRPELINRFDAVILFHPLRNTDLLSIAKNALSKLAKRVKENDIELVVNDDVVSFLVEKGSDPLSGGRSINRVIQNEIEDLIAKKMISGEVHAGSRLEIKKEDLSL